MASEVGIPVRVSASDLAPPPNHWKGGPHVHIGNEHYPVSSPNTINPR